HSQSKWSRALAVLFRQFRHLLITFRWRRFIEEWRLRCPQGNGRAPSIQFPACQNVSQSSYGRRSNANGSLKESVDNSVSVAAQTAPLNQITQIPDRAQGGDYYRS